MVPQIFVTSISKYVAMGTSKIENEAILKDQNFELIYAQYGYLYMMFSHAPRPTSSIEPTPDISHVTDGLIGSMN